MGADGDWSWVGVIRMTGGVGVEGECTKHWERRLEFGDFCFGNEVQWKFYGIYKGNPNEDS